MGFGYRTSRFKLVDAGRFVVCEVGFLLREGAPTINYSDVIRHLEAGGTASPSLGDVRAAVLAIRRRKGMVLDDADPDTRSVGSFFVNPSVASDIHADLEAALGETVPGFHTSDHQIKIPAAWLIERAGFRRGHQAGRVAISSKHPLALVNRGGATAREVLHLATEIKRKVADQFGIFLVPEPAFVGFGDDDDVAYLTDQRGQS